MSGAKIQRRSAVLCEGPDDLWFISYYLHKTAGWELMKKPKELWDYQVNLSTGQHANYLRRGRDTALIWAVRGKDSYKSALEQLFNFNRKYPNDPVHSIVIVRDRDEETEQEIFQKWNEQDYFPVPLVLNNREAVQYAMKSLDGRNVVFAIIPVIIPFQEEGAVETLLMRSIAERGPVDQGIVGEAQAFVGAIHQREEVRKAGYLNHARLVLKAKFSAVISITNPDHSTGLFQDIVLDCPWEESQSVREHFEAIRTRITSEEIIG